jgi:uncharacterized surface protein with fasciclin (FAS1) repeats
MISKNRLIVACMLGLGATASLVYVSSSPAAADSVTQPNGGVSQVYNAAAKEAKDIVDTAVGTGQFKTLATALTAAGLVDTLKGAGPFTVFAPTDAAFAKLPEGTVAELLKPESKEKLTAILTYHVVSGKAMAKDVQGLSKVKTLNGKELPLKVADGKVMVGNATVTTADVEASNGVIHVIDTVLLP